jgi:translation initiation factor 2 alpha subunit (eIF-2alpha)
LRDTKPAGGFNMELEEGDIVLGTVDRIVGTNVFVKIHLTDKEAEGTITFSEVAPGRIRNIRDYVVPKKKIVCKVLRISGDRIDLSLRRVTQKEQKEIMGQDKLEKSYERILSGILGEKSKKAIEEILKTDKIYDFLEEAKENPKNLEKIIGKADAKKVLDILKNQKKKKSVLKKEISFKSFEPNGIELIKNLLSKIKDIEIKYISAGHYSLKTEAEDIKKADHELKEILENLEKEAKKSGIEFSIIKK